MANLDPFDKISDLPDAMIHHILSFLTTKEAVATSILSKRWLHLWTLVPVLDIEQSPVPYCSDNKIREKIQQKFCDFVSNVFQRNKSVSLEKFRLKCYADASPFGKWIFPATARGLQELDLNVSCSSTKNDFRWKLTTSFFNELRLLKVLKLSNRVRVDISETVSFPNLKILHLVLVEYRDDRSVGILFSGCVVLQELFIKRTPFDYVQSFNISIPTLKTLSIELEGQHDVEINAPALEYLNLKDDMSMSSRNLVRNIPRSIEGVISWSSKRTTQILRAMCSVESLSLSGNIWCNELIRFGFNRVLQWYGLSGNIFQEQDFSLMFVNLVRLELDVGLFGWIFMPVLLKTSPILQVLVLSVSEAFQVGDEHGSSLPKHVPKCFSSHLETVCFRKFAGLEREVRLIEYILTNVRVLKTMTICSDGSFSDSDFLLHKKLSEIPRCSETCQLEFKCQES